MALVGIDNHIANSIPALLFKRLVSRLELAKLRYYKRNPVEKKRVDLITKIYNEESGVVLFSPGELLMVHEQAWLQRNHGGDFAEVGVFRGASAKAICEAKGDRLLHLFDTFEGLPEVGEPDARFRKGMFVANESSVRERLSLYPNVRLYKGLFPATAEPVKELKFSFVHLDVDLYSVTKTALEFFYPRMLPGGKILSHDYGQCEGVWKAFDEFMSDKPEELIPLDLTQVMIIKV